MNTLTTETLEARILMRLISELLEAAEDRTLAKSELLPVLKAMKGPVINLDAKAKGNGHG